MARIRTVKPSFWSDPELVALPFEARLFFIGTWTYADDFGVLKDEPARLKLEIMPADQIDPAAVVDMLVASGHLLRRIAPDGTRVLVIRTFCDHQKIDMRKKGRWGHPDDFSEHQVATESADTRPSVPERDEPRPDAPTGVPVLDGTGRDSPLPPNPAALERRRQTIFRSAVEKSYRTAVENGVKIGAAQGWKSAVFRNLLEDEGEHLQRLLEQFPRAPDDVLASALLGDTHSLGSYRAEGAGVNQRGKRESG